MYEAPSVKWTKEHKLNFYKNYLKQLWFPDIKPFDKAHSDILRQLFREASEKIQNIGILARSKDDMYRIGQVWLMSFGKREPVLKSV